MCVIKNALRCIGRSNRTVNITRQYHMIDMMLDVRVGDTVSLTVLRNGEEVTVEIEITEDCLTAY